MAAVMLSVLLLVMLAVHARREGSTMTTDPPQDGGPAFAHTIIMEGGQLVHGYVGISKLLWLAAHAPVHPDDVLDSDKNDAAWRFKWAQAMLAEHARLTDPDNQ